MADIPGNHPRKASLMARQSLVEAAAEGLLAESAMIAHGRGKHLTIFSERRHRIQPDWRFVRWLLDSWLPTTLSSQLTATQSF